MRLRASTLAAAVTVLAICFTAGVGQAETNDHYGGVSTAVRARMKAMIWRAFRPYGVQSVMECIANRESGYNPQAANWHDSNGGSFGLFQINGVHRHYGESVNHFARRMWNPVNNLNFAVRLYATSGLSPWGGGC